MPASAGVVQEAGNPRRPSISTRQRRHDPNGSSVSVAQSFGMFMPAAAAAYITELPSGTVMETPLISREIVLSDVFFGVPRSIELMACIITPYCKGKLATKSTKDLCSAF